MARASMTVSKRSVSAKPLVWFSSRCTVMRAAADGEARTKLQVSAPLARQANLPAFNQVEHANAINDLLSDAIRHCV